MQNDCNPPNWNIWEYVVATGTLHTILPTTDPSGTGSQYISPHYLPDGRILFATTRQLGSGAVLLNEGKPEFEGQTEASLDESAFVLHVMNADGTGMHQITYNQSHDIDATVLANGRVMCSRWDHADGNERHASLYQLIRTAPTCSCCTARAATTLSAAIRAAPPAVRRARTARCSSCRAREMPNGKVLALVRPFTEADFGGNLAIIDVKNYVENNQALPG